jgi:predicted RNA-binding protein with TRAM domain
MGKYIRSKHDEYITCKNCKERNAPQDSKNFENYCHNCGARLETEAPIEVGDKVEVFVDDIHEKGDGVGKMDNGFVVLVEGVIPEETVKAKITNVKDTYAEAKPVERDLETPEYVKNREDNEDDEENKQNRRDFWGNN